MKFIAGSKTFFIGEYSVVFGGSCIVFICDPIFELIVEKGSKELIGINKNSPGYKFYNLHQSDFKEYEIKFCDPHNGKGGWGASSAQYTLLYKFFLNIKKMNFNLSLFLNEYRNIAKSGNIFPSGADCLSQYYNHNIYYDSSKNIIEKIEWKFPNLDFFILKTNTKISTYKHLRNLVNLDISKLQFFVEQVKNSFNSLDEKEFLKNFQNFFYELEKNNLVISQTSLLVRKILELKHVKAAKGCGALSSDTILVIFDRGYRDLIESSIMQLIN